MLDWLRRIFATEHTPRPALTPEPRGLHVLHNGDLITVKTPGAPDVAIAWTDITAVRIVSGDATADPPDLFWLIAGGDRRRPVLVPMGVAGEHDLVHAMQERLDGFDNMAVVEAMSAKGPIGFKVWDAEMSGTSDAY
ncbi:MAG: hypothetical protein B7Y80_07420 [Hyphomicrobium sp. 32-62-53]|nr:MAG: hypothetical protein B7Z29_04100 [Hyphomicrobium sp. 12-62-95]OYY00441.1 MAG: hypothetical protein B7Y80_07420 [Hyphomicrobium sp. 32-62-53]